MSGNGLWLAGWSGSRHDTMRCAEVVCFEHFFCTHGFFFFPEPPNLGLSKQNLHEPQSLARHPLHSPHLLRLLPKVSWNSNMKIIGIMLNLPITTESWTRTAWLCSVDFLFSPLDSMSILKINMVDESAHNEHNFYTCWVCIHCFLCTCLHEFKILQH